VVADFPDVPYGVSLAGRVPKVSYQEASPRNLPPLLICFRCVDRVSNMPEYRVIQQAGLAK